MDLNIILHAFIPSSTSVAMFMAFFTYLAIFGSILPERIISRATLSDGTRLHYRCLLLLVFLVILLGIGVRMDLVSSTTIDDRGLELLSTTLIFSVIVTCEHLPRMSRINMTKANCIICALVPEAEI